MSNSEISVASIDHSLECNFDVLKSNQNHSNDDDDLLEFSDADSSKLSTNNPYIKDLLLMTKSKILQIDAVNLAYLKMEIDL